jgi:ElaB/YqjD/DUF883 family membrane-anchored ribosome-binding protein
MQTTADQSSVVDPATSGSETVNRIAGTAHEAVDRIAQGAHSALQSFRHGSESWKETGDQSLEHVQAYVREKPLLALGAALAAGFLLSRLIR